MLTSPYYRLKSTLTTYMIQRRSRQCLAAIVFGPALLQSEPVAPTLLQLNQGGIPAGRSAAGQDRLTSRCTDKAPTTAMARLTSFLTGKASTAAMARPASHVTRNSTHRTHSNQAAKNSRSIKERKAIIPLTRFSFREVQQ